MSSTTRSGQEFGDDPLHAALAASRSCAPAHVADRLFQAVTDFDARLTDDATLLVVARK